MSDDSIFASGPTSAKHFYIGPANTLYKGVSSLEVWTYASYWFPRSVLINL